MLEADRIDMIAYGDIAATNYMKMANINYRDYEIVFVFRRGTGNFAFNKEVDSQVLQVLQSAFDKLNNEGIIRTIRNNYIKSFENSL